MATGATGQLGLALPVQGELSGTWGDTVNNGITQYTNIAIAATLTLTNDGAVTLANTTGDATASNIVSSLTGAGTVTAQFAIVRVTGTLTTAKVVTAPSYSKTYTVVNAATGGIVTFKASGQTGVSIAVGESAFVYYNGTDYVKVSGTSAVSSFTAGTTGFTPNTATTGAVTLAGTLATTNGGTGLTSFTSGGVVYASSSSALATGSVLTFDGTKLSVGSGASTSAGLISGYFGASGYGAIWSTGVTPSTSNFAFTTNGTSTGLNGSSNVFIQANNTDVVNINTVGVLINTATNVNNAKLKSKVTGGGIGLEITDEATSDFVVVPAVSSGVCKIGPTSGSMSFQTAGSERMRLDTGGNFIVGGTTAINSSGGRGNITINGSSNAILNFGVGSVEKGYVYYDGTNLSMYNVTNNPIVFGTNGTARARIDAVGNVLVGGTAARGTTVGAAHLDLFNGTAPAGTLTDGISLYSSSGDLKFMNAAGDAFDVGYRNIPQNSQSANYTLTLADAGDHIFHPVGDNNARTFTIPANSSVAYPIGTAITFINMAAANVTIAITSDTMYLSSAGTTGSRTLAQYGSATAIKITSTNWLISGSGLT
jgi:hypothetical protein